VLARIAKEGVIKDDLAVALTAACDGFTRMWT